MKYYLVLDLKDLPGERWVDCDELNNEYQVSNFGRIKSLERILTASDGKQRLVKSRIRKQQIHYSRKQGKLTPNSLAININRRTYTMSKLVYVAFYPKNKIEEDEVIMHVNKDFSDNTLENLRKVSRTDSRLLDAKYSPAALKAMKKNISKASKARLEYFEKRTHEICKGCKKELPIEDFVPGRRYCTPCFKISQKEYEKKRNEKRKAAKKNKGNAAKNKILSKKETKNN